MKKIAFGIACGMAACYIFVMMLAVYGRSVRSQEADAALSQAMDSTLSNVMSGKNDRIADDKSLVAEFLKALLIQENSDSDISVAILEADCEYGILSAEVTETFTHPNGKRGSVSEARTMIFDREKDEKKEWKTVSFYTADKELYKEYALPDGSACAVPVPPEKEGMKFCGWRFLAGGSGAAQSVTVPYAGGQRSVLAAGGAPYRVSEDAKLVAVFQKD